MIKLEVEGFELKMVEGLRHYDYSILVEGLSVTDEFDVNKFNAYIEAYDPEKCKTEINTNDKVSIDGPPKSIWNQVGDGVFGLVFVNKEGELSISDEFAEAIKAKILVSNDMPKNYSVGFNSADITDSLCKHCFLPITKVNDVWYHDNMMTFCGNSTKAEPKI